MRPHITFILFVLHLLAYALNSTLLAQNVVWEAKLERDGVLPQEWQGNIDDYLVDKGFIRLNATSTDRLTSFISTPIKLSDDNAWQGVLSFEREPTKYNYTYILLACIAKNDKEQRYLALAFGGKTANIRLCEAVFIPNGTTYVHSKSRDIDLLSTQSLSHTYYPLLSFYVRLRQNRYLSLYLSKQNLEQAELIDEVEYPLQLSQDNEFALYSAFTEKRRTGFSYGELRVLDAESRNTNSERPIYNTTASEREQPRSSFIFSEVMANPLAHSVEYIELYQSGDVSTSLQGYSLAIRGIGDKMYYYPFPQTTNLLHPGDYYVFTSNPEVLQTTYPFIEEEHIIKMKLPKLRNTGFTLQLYKEKQLVDELIYDPNVWQRGLRTKRGVSLERIEMTTQQQNYLPAQKYCGYATPTQANSHSRSVMSGLDKEDDVQILLSEIIKRLEQEEGTTATLRLYDFVGSTLAAVSSSGSIEMLKAINQNPYAALRKWTDYVYRPMLLVIYLTTSEGEQECYDLKLAFSTSK